MNATSGLKDQRFDPRLMMRAGSYCPVGKPTVRPTLMLFLGGGVFANSGMLRAGAPNRLTPTRIRASPRPVRSTAVNWPRYTPVMFPPTIGNDASTVAERPNSEI